ncbi:HAD hydrolase-like protein [Lacrimispora sp.]|uniref:HAD hydrolase-like protein n=1 Tax=Lacrimispora sp. TaxID=2719234 RepID=UPI0028A5B121|nr:HAD hydrolase-like protein [Lacrimispora sp.]
MGHKPDPDPLFKYMEVSNASNNELIYIGDSVYDWECAKSAKVDFALAGWGSLSREIQADYYLEKPDDLLSIMRDRSYDVTEEHSIVCRSSNNSKRT